MPVRVFETMGTTVSLRSRLAVADDAIAAVVAVFAAHDHRYSLYRPQSELSSIASGRLALIDASDELRITYAAALEWRNRTGGAFTPHRPDGVIDLSGTVKAAAMRDAGEVLALAGVDDWCLNVGGDVLVSGRPDPGHPWVVGIVDPADRRMLLTSVSVSGPRTACATSGSAERGDHIWTRGATPSPFVQVTVVANDIEVADVLATAVIAGGETTLDLVTRSFDIDVLTVDRVGELRATPGLREAIEGSGALAA
ncbi:MAG TPA: FAD:protein FMN transferase [Galbitalea sp.]|jgi:thiamine biosynthesis lipoprotein